MVHALPIVSFREEEMRLGCMHDIDSCNEGYRSMAQLKLIQKRTHLVYTCHAHALQAYAYICQLRCITRMRTQGHGVWGAVCVKTPKFVDLTWYLLNVCVKNAEKHTFVPSILVNTSTSECLTLVFSKYRSI